MTSVAVPPRCRDCSAILSPPGNLCTACGAQQAEPARPVLTSNAPAKSTGVAVLLSFLWLGAGHLYADKIGSGIALALFSGFLLLLGLTGIGLILVIPIWLVVAPIVMAMSASAVKDFNRRNGVVVR